ncbi:MAG TPA: hypothetical protein VGZ90_13345 [Puia sp.]|jgi:hypothetical protein|nr:hypothetical protein [Puia sp.]
MSDAVLQGQGIGPGIDYSGFQHAVQAGVQNRYRREQMALRQQGRKDLNQEFEERQLDPSKRITGTIYDGYISDGYNQLINQSSQLAQEGKSIPEIQGVIGPKLTQMSNQYNTIKQMNKQIEEYGARFKGQPGYNAEALISHAKGMAFQNYDADKKMYTGMKDVNSLDPNTNWVEEAIKQHPEDISNEEGIQKAINSSKQDVYNPRTVTSVAGKKYETGYDAKMYPWQQFSKETDEYKNPKSVETHGDIIHTADGQDVHIATDPVFHDFMGRVGVAPYINAETKKAFQAAGGEAPRQDSPQWETMQKHILYDILDRNSAKTYSPVSKSTETGAAAKIEIRQADPAAYYKNIHDEAEAHAEGTAAGKPATEASKKTNVAGAIGGVFNNDPNYTSGDMTELPDGRKVIDVTSKMPTGALKFGKDKNQEYTGVYFDPLKRSLIVNKGKQQEEIPESQAGQFITRVAEANGLPMSKVRGELAKMGFQNGKFQNAGQSDFTERIAQAGQAAQEKHNSHVDDLIDKEKYSSIKGMKTADGEAVEGGERNFVSKLFGDKYYVTVKGKDGKTKDVTFADKEKMADYLKGGAQAPKPVSQAAPSATVKKGVLD